MLASWMLVMVVPGLSSFPSRQVLCIPVTRPCPRCSVRGKTVTETEK